MDSKTPKSIARGLGLVLALGVIVVSGFIGGANRVEADVIDDLRAELKAKKEELKKAEDRIEKFKEEIQIKKKEAKTLEQQIDLIDDNIERLRLNINQTELEIQETRSEIAVTEEEINIKEQEISHQKEKLASYIRSMYELNQQSQVAVFLAYKTFSEAINETSTWQELQARGQKVLVEIKGLRDDLENKRQDLEAYKKVLEELRQRQEKQQATLAANRNSKERILDLTRSQEEEFKKLLSETKKTHEQAEEEIKRLDSKVREELEKQGIAKLPSVGVFDWPVKTIFGVSCEFHCPDYPYAYLLGPHSGIDIPTYVGTPIKAPADGYVARTHNAGGPGYSYILLLHGDNVSTVYGHVSGFNIAEDQMVSRGMVIGYTGGVPGTNGAGLSTGPHLHFEVRKNNVPINPRLYL